MKTILIRLLNASIIILSELLIFFPTRILLNVVQLIYGILYTIHRYILTAHNPKDGTELLKATQNIIFYFQNYRLAFLSCIGYTFSTRVTIKQPSNIPQSPAENSRVLPIDY